MTLTNPAKKSGIPVVTGQAGIQCRIPDSRLPGNDPEPGIPGVPEQEARVFQQLSQHVLTHVLTHVHPSSNGTLCVSDSCRS
jgi:hypothetical protein